MNTVRPRCFGTSQFVRARQSPQSDHHAPVVHTFDPLSDPFVAVADGGRERSGDVGAAARLGQQLHPDLFAPEDGGDVALLLFLRTELEQHRQARRQGGHLQSRWMLVAHELLVERAAGARG